LLDDLNEVPGLVKMLKPDVKSTAIGSWIPDLQDSKPGSGDIDNHILKMKPYDGGQRGRFVLKKDDLLKKLGPKRSIHGFIKNDTNLSDGWWKTPYKAKPRPGQHLANRSMALTTTLIDQLILGDPTVAGLVPGTIRFASKLDPEARSRREEVATYFFMLSHFVADSCMPCHCDARHLAGYSRGLHKELEANWSKIVGTFFAKKRLLSSTLSSKSILSTAKEVDAKFNIKFPDTIPALKAVDVWKEIVFVCRASFALSCIMAPQEKYPFGSRKKAPFDTLFGDGDGKLLLKDINRVVMHDAVLNIAVVWKNIWKTFK